MTSLPETDPPTDSSPDLPLPQQIIVRVEADRGVLEPLRTDEYKEVYGGKGYGLIKMKTLGCPVPDGFILTTGAYQYVQAHKGFDEEFIRVVHEEIQVLESATNRTLGDSAQPLFVSVRSAPRASMPGIMETFVNVGITLDTIGALEKEIGEGAAWQSYFALIQSFGTKIFGLNPEIFPAPQGLPISDLKKRVLEAKQTVETFLTQRYTDNYIREIFDNPLLQLQVAIHGVYQSWVTPAAKAERLKRNIRQEEGLAVIIQQMKWGNSEAAGSGSGVAFSRNQITLEGPPLVDFRTGQQGTHAVAADTKTGTRQLTLEDLPEPLRSEMRRHMRRFSDPKNFAYPQDIEFTVQVIDGKQHIFFLQTRDAKMANVATFRLAREQLRDGLLTINEAMRRVSPKVLYGLLKPDLEQSAVGRAIREGRLIAQGTNIAPGAARGILVRSIAGARLHRDKHVILSCALTPEDLRHLPGNVVAIVAENGGGASHLARHAEEVGADRSIPIVFGATIDSDRYVTENLLTVDGTNGLVFFGYIPMSNMNGNRLLGRDELSVVRRWIKEREANPWRFAVAQADAQIYEEPAAQALIQMREHRAHKAKEYSAFNLLIPSEMRMNYEAIPIVRLHPEKIRIELNERLHKLLDEGHDLTVRTAHSPQRKNAGPYATLTTHGEIDQFLTTYGYGKHGGLPAFLADHDVTELIIGQIPKGKMDPEHYRLHFSWTLRMSKSGIMVLQIVPFSPLLRAQGEAKPDDMITMNIDMTQDRPLSERVEILFGKKLQMEENITEARQFFDYTLETVLHDWVNNRDLLPRLAAVASVFPTSRYNSVVLGGQGRIDQGGIRRWLLCYDFNIDQLKHPILRQLEKTARQIQSLAEKIVIYQHQ